MYLLTSHHQKKKKTKNQVKTKCLIVTTRDINLITPENHECRVNLRIYSPVKYHVVSNHMIVMESTVVIV